MIRDKDLAAKYIRSIESIRRFVRGGENRPTRDR